MTRKAFAKITSFLLALIMIMGAIPAAGAAETDTETEEAVYNGTTLVSVNKNIEGVYVVESGTTHIAPNAFKDCTKLTRVIFSDELLSIGESAFENCQSLRIVRTSPNVTEVGENAFKNCSEELKFISADDDDDFFPTYCEDRGYTYMSSNRHLDYGFDFVFIDGTVMITGSNGSSEVTIPYAVSGCYVTEILDGAFRNKDNITRLTVQTKCARIGESAFENCTSLNSILLLNTEMVIGKDAFKNTAAYNNEAKWNNGIFYISGYAIEAKEDLEGTVRLPYNTYSIASEAFRDCKNIEKIVIPEGVRTIGNTAFKGCDSLTYIKIPSTLKTVENNAFKYSGEGLELYCPVSYEYAETCAKENGVPLNIIDKYTVYNEEWDITMTALDDLTFKVEEIDTGAEEFKDVDEKLMGTTLGKFYYITIIDPYTNEEVDPYTEVLVKAPIENHILCELWCEVDSNDNFLGYYIESFDNIEIKDGYAEFSLDNSASVADLKFAYYSTVDEATGIEFTLPTLFFPETVEYILRANSDTLEEAFAFFDAYIENGTAYALLEFEIGSDFLDSMPSDLDIAIKVPTNGELMLVYKNFDSDTMTLVPLDRVENSDGFVTLTFSAEEPEYNQFLLATTDEIPTEPSEPSTEPSDPEESKPATDPAETDPEASTSATESKDNTGSTDASDSTDATKGTDASEGTNPTDKTEPEESDSTNPSATAPDTGFTLGDVNRDGKLNIRDATLIQKFLAKIAELDSEQKALADFNLDAKINIKDATMIQKKIANLI